MSGGAGPGAGGGSERERERDDAGGAESAGAGSFPPAGAAPWPSRPGPPPDVPAGAQPWPDPQPAGAAAWPGPSPVPGPRSPLAVLALVAAAVAVCLPVLSIVAWHLFIELPAWQAVGRVTSVLDGLAALAALVVGVVVARRPARIERLAGGLAIGAGAVGLLGAGFGLVFVVLALLR